MTPPRRLLSISHSYSVALNRRLAEALAHEGSDTWEVTAVAPSFFHGDLRPVVLEESSDDRCTVLPTRARWTRSRHLFSYSGRLRQVLRQGWDLVHCWEEPFVVAGWQAAISTPRSTPFVFWSGQNLAKTYPPPFSWMEDYVLSRASGWLACGHTVAETLLARGYDRRPHAVAPLGVDLAVFRPDPDASAHTRRSLGWEDGGAPVIGYLGRFVPEKGIALLIDCLDGLRKPWRALFVGGGPMEPALEALSERHPGQVRIVTGVAHDEVPRHIASMDVLVAPSETTPAWREQFGRMLIEAFACGVAVVASDSGEIPYVVSDAGVVLPEGDRAAWSATLERLLEDDAWRRELGLRGLDRARSEYCWRVIARRTLAFFDQVTATAEVSAA